MNIHSFSNFQLYESFLKNKSQIYQEMDSIYEEIESSIDINDFDKDLKNLLLEASKYLKGKFGIDPSEKKYFISGSARLYIFPKLREELGLTSKIGDLDIVIPDRKLWDKAGLSDKDIWSPNDKIEFFDVWDPSRGPYPEHKSYKPRETSEMLKDASNIGGFYFMKFSDIIDYKLNLKRTKEQDVIEIFLNWQQNPSKKNEYTRKLIEIIGKQKAKRLFI